MATFKHIKTVDWVIELFTFSFIIHISCFQPIKIEKIAKILQFLKSQSKSFTILPNVKLSKCYFKLKVR